MNRRKGLHVGVVPSSEEVLSILNTMNSFNQTERKPVITMTSENESVYCFVEGNALWCSTELSVARAHDTTSNSAFQATESQKNVLLTCMKEFTDDKSCSVAGKYDGATRVWSLEMVKQIGDITFNVEQYGQTFEEVSENCYDLVQKCVELLSM